MNLDTLSSDSSEEEIRDSGSSFLFPDSWGSDLYFPYFGKYSSLPGGGINLCTSHLYPRLPRDRGFRGHSGV